MRSNEHITHGPAYCHTGTWYIYRGPKINPQTAALALVREHSSLGNPTYNCSPFIIICHSIIKFVHEYLEHSHRRRYFFSSWSRSSAFRNVFWTICGIRFAPVLSWCPNDAKLAARPCTPEFHFRCLRLYWSTSTCFVDLSLLLQSSCLTFVFVILLLIPLWHLSWKMNEQHHGMIYHTNEQVDTQLASLFRQEYYSISRYPYCE